MTVSADGLWRWNTPPGWPEPPPGWQWTPEFRPDPSWPAPPTWWAFWVANTAASPEAVFVLEGSEPLEVVGESYRQDALNRITKKHGARLRDGVRVDVLATLVPEPTNPHDPNAVAVWVEGHMVGYLSRADAVSFQPAVRRLTAERGHVTLRGTIVGGGLRDDGVGMLGVFLQYSPEAFGLPNPHARTMPASMRTGLSSALVTDLDDDSYDLAWMAELSTTPSRRVSQLRALLAEESDPISRHFMHASLESDLYSLRDITPAVLDEYDKACQEHDAEMDDHIRPALLAKFGSLPLLETYRQMAVRQQKAKNLELALWWAQRGLDLYADKASNPDWVEDLQHRASKYWEKLQATLPSKRASAKTTTSPSTPMANAGTEVLTCVECGSTWERTVTRGRKPQRCPACVTG